MKNDVRIVARNNGVGIDRDVEILRTAIGRWTEPPAFSGYRSISPLRQWVGHRRRGSTIVFLERVATRWLRSAEQFILIPNQERFPRRLLGTLRRVDHILCKSRHARSIFAEHHESVHYSGFTSIDRRMQGVAPDAREFFHLGGGSSLKGTDMLVGLWRRRPDWPRLTVVWHRRGGIEGRMPDNIRMITHYLPDEELRRLQNECGVHLCPSRSEGWGHYLVEAMSCGATVVTTDGPPMNEIVGPARGVLVPHDHSEPRKMGVNYFMDVVALERSVDELVSAPAAHSIELGQAARAWYEENHRAFLARLEALWDGVV